MSTGLQNFPFFVSQNHLHGNNFFLPFPIHTHPPTYTDATDQKSNASGIVVSFTEDAKERKKDSLESSKLQRTVEVCSHQGLEWAGICWYRMSALYVEQYDADWGVHTSASSSLACVPSPTTPHLFCIKGYPQVRRHSSQKAV